MSIKLTDTQRDALLSGAQNPNGEITLSKRVRGGAAAKVVASLVAAKLADTRKGLLVITATGLAAIGERPTAPKVARTDTKQAQLIAMMRRPEGVTIDEAVERLDWQAHTVRGAIAGALKKKLGLNVVSEPAEGSRKTTYRIAG